MGEGDESHTNDGNLSQAEGTHGDYISHKEHPKGINFDCRRVHGSYERKV